MILHPFTLALLTVSLEPPEPEPEPDPVDEDGPGSEDTSAELEAAESESAESESVEPELEPELEPEVPVEPQTVWESPVLCVRSEATSMKLFIDVHGDDVVIELETSPNGECWLPVTPKRKTGSAALLGVDELLAQVKARVTYKQPPAPEGHICLMLVADRQITATAVGS